MKGSQQRSSIDNVIAHHGEPESLSNAAGAAAARSHHGELRFARMSRARP